MAPQFCRAETRANGTASILAMATANPPTVIEQTKYPDFLFGITNSDHKTELKNKFRQICAESGIKKRHFALTEEILKANPSLCTAGERSLDVRQDFAFVEVPRLAKEAALKAIAEWGQSKDKITHVVCSAMSGLKAPGIELTLIKLLGLSLETNRVMMYHQDGYAGAAALRVAKDLAENNKGARVLVVCSEITAYTFLAPHESHPDGLISSALLGDGAAVFVVGSDPLEGVEKPILEICSTAQTILPHSDGALLAHIREEGLYYKYVKDIPSVLCHNVEGIVSKLLAPFETKPSNNDLFWAVHPGTADALYKLEKKLGLDESKLEASKEVLASYGNLSSAALLFVIHQLKENGFSNEYGVAIGYGPGITVESVLLRKV